MMKKEVKYLVSGVLIGAMAVSIPTLADTIWEKIDVARNAIKLDVNGTPVESDLFLYNDTTYVPIRVVSEMLGKTVTYNPETQSASILDSQRAEFEGEAIGKVGNDTITSGELDAYLSMMAKDPSYSALTGDAATQKAKELIIHDHILMQIGESYGIAIDQEFNNSFADLMTFNKMQKGEEGLNAILEAQGMDQNSYKHFYEVEHVKERLLQKSDFSVDETELRTYYDSHMDEFAFDGLRAKHIYINSRDADGNPLTGQALEEAKAKAEEAYQKLQSGSDFDALVQEYGEDPGMEENPDGYVFNRGMMITEFEDAAYQLDAGEISEVVTTPIGFHIIKVEETLPYLPFEEAKADLKDKLSNQKLEDSITSKTASVNITL